MTASGLLGTPAYAVGTPALANFVPGGGVNRLPTGQQTGSVAISTGVFTRGQYVYDAFGMRQGIGDVTQLVILALSTKLGTSIVKTLGHRLGEIAKITDSFPQETTTRVEEALSGVTGRKLLDVVSVKVTPDLGHPAKTHVQAIDLTTQNPIDLSI